MATDYTKELKPTTNYTKEIKPRDAGDSTFDFGKFDQAQFDGGNVTTYTKESKPTTSYTKETKP